jgi:hypothetical protein
MSIIGNKQNEYLISEFSVVQTRTYDIMKANYRYLL